MWNYPIGLVSSIILWFEQVQKDWTTPNSCKTTLLACDPQSYSSSSRFSMIALPRTHVKLPCRHGSHSDTVVRTGSEGLNYPELVRNYPIDLVSPIVQWFDPQSNSGSSRCRRFELPRTHVKLPYGPGFLNRAVVRAGSEGLNYPELLRNYPTGQVSSVKLWFEQIQEDWTTPNSLETTLQARFTRSYSGSSRFRRIELPWTL